MTTNNKKPLVIGVGGFARAGKDTFVKVAKKILTQNGYSSTKLAFADALKSELDPFLREYYGIDAWTDDTKEKSIIRPIMVAHGCQKRIQTNGRYWVDKIDETLKSGRINEDVVFVSDCRFPNEADWLHNNWGGWFVHLKKYSVQDLVYHKEIFKDGYLTTERVENKNQKVFDTAPNSEEATNDPICEQKADYRLELENVMEKTLRETGNKITVDSLVDDSYLLNEITICLSSCPSLTIQNQQNPKSIWSSVQHLNTTNYLGIR